MKDSAAKAERYAIMALVCVVGAGVAKYHGETVDLWTMRALVLVFSCVLGFYIGKAFTDVPR